MTPHTSTRVVLVHGVGLGAGSFVAVVDRLAQLGIEAEVIRRRGYDDRPAHEDLGVHVDDLLDVAAAGPGPCVLAGVSGGATLALAAAVTRGHPLIAAAVVHEPLVGPGAPSQHVHVTESITTMLDDDAPESTARFLERLVTPSRWHTLDPYVRACALAHGDVIRHEAPAFARFSLSPTAIQTSPTPITWTVGRHSPRWRHEAAELAADLGARVEELDAVHTPQLEDPDGFVSAIVSALPAVGVR